jgi:NADP-dependent 3-hydroxy acid dehydrogenase YdfG
MFEIEGKHILITGASSGFGRHFATFLAKKAAKVTLAARRREALTGDRGSGRQRAKRDS